MAYSIFLKEKAITLRRKGYSIKEVAQKLKIAQSTSSLWLHNINLNKSAMNRLKNRKILEQYKSMKIAEEKRAVIRYEFRNKLLKTISIIHKNNALYKTICSLLFWAEGSKSLSFLSFTNSDSKMVSLFLHCLRSSFNLDEKKFRIKVHIHGYHNDSEIKKYWSFITNIPPYQFTKSYLKPNTEKRVRENYKGCINIRYYDYRVALELCSLYNTFIEEILGV
jgi:hypothetical protein